MSEPRFVEVEVEAGDGLEEAVSLRFRAIGSSRPVTRITLSGDEQAGTFAVTALDENGQPTGEPALATEVEDSSEGVALLVHGGAGGLRLVGMSGEAARREACLLVAKGTSAS